MIKINYKKPEASESPDDICIHNLTISDKYKNLSTFSQSSIAWLKNDPSRDYQDLENLIRTLDLDTHLIAKPYEKSIYGELNLTIPNRINQTEELTHVLLISCRKKEEAIKELEKFHSSYEENYALLKKTGCLTDINSNKKTKEFENSINSINTENKQVDPETQILNSEIKYDFINVTGKESIQVIIEDLTKKYDKEPEKKICGKLGEKDIYSLIINGEIVSPIGWIEDEFDYQLIDFRMLRKTC